MNLVFDEDELLPLSGLQHLAFCERRWALVHVERLWAENQFTAEGELLHERVHSGELESRPDVLLRRTVPLRSLQLGLSGQADVLEFHRVGDDAEGTRISGRSGRWRPVPIEYKRTRERSAGLAYHVQLCAQALCLEEMLEVAVPEGAIFDGRSKRRQTVSFTSELRDRTAALAARMHELFHQNVTPPPVTTAACERCSMVEICRPRVFAHRRDVAAYIASRCGTDEP